jgi:hypothetical protein
MKCITVMEQQAWLSRKKMLEQPYRSNQAPKHHIQFQPPKHLRAVEAFTHNLTELFLVNHEALLSVTDWALYQPYEMRLFESVRRVHGEERSLIAAPGHLLRAIEKDDLIGLFSLSVAFEWTSYLYFLDARVTLLNWEGAIFNLWAQDAQRLQAASKLLGAFSLDPL